MNEKMYCKKCGGFVQYCTEAALLSSPPKYRGVCKDCNETCYIYIHEYNKINEIGDNVD